MKKKILLIFLCLFWGITVIATAQISVSIPDTFAVVGDTVLLPVNVSDLSNTNIFSYQFVLQHNNKVLHLLSAINEGTLSSQWSSPLVNTENMGGIMVGSFGINRLSGSGVLLYLKFKVIGAPADSSSLELQNFVFNAGQPAAITSNGLINVYGPPISVLFITNIEKQVQIIIDGQIKTTPFDTSWLSYTEHSIGTFSPQYQTSEVKFVFDRWSDKSDTVHFVAPVSDTIFQCIMEIKYLLTVQSKYGEVQGQGWYSQGATTTISADSLIAEEDTSRYVFSRWIGNGDGAYSGENRIVNIIINNPVTETAQWIGQHYLKIESSVGFPVGQGWYDEGDTVEIQIDSLEYLNDDTRFQFNSWQGIGAGSYSGTSLAANIIVNNPIIEKAVWDKQFYLSIFATPENIIEFDKTGWYKENEPTIEILAPNTVEQTNIKYRFVNWLVDETLTEQNPVSVQMDTAHILNAVYQIDSVLVEITTDAEDGFFIYVDSLSYSTPYSQFWKYQTEHIIGIDSVIFLSDSLSRYVFDQWDDGGDLFHSVRADSSLKISAALLRQYYLLVETIPPGLINFEETGWYIEGDSIQLPEVPQQVFTETDSFLFNTWMVDSLLVAGNPISLNMNKHHHAVANYENLYFIAGTISDSRGLPLDGVKMFLNGASEDTVTSTESGQYFFSALVEGNYQVLPSFENYEFIPQFKEYAPLNSSQPDQDFLATDILDPQVTLLYPTGGQWLKKTTIDTIKWSATDNVGIDSIVIQLTVDGGGDWWNIAEFDSGNVSQFIWTIPDTISKQCLIKLEVFDFDGNNAWDMSDSMFTIGSIAEVNDRFASPLIPTEFKVEQNYPNPFNNSTVIPFQLPKTSLVTIDIYNVNGQRVRILAAKNFKAGYHRVNWNGKDQFGRSVSSGVYLFRVEALKKVVIKKFLYVR